VTQKILLTKETKIKTGGVAECPLNEGSFVSPHGRRLYLTEGNEGNEDKKTEDSYKT
jgi:hypothetical protein